MTYELAKQLKDAGFPQTGDFWWVQLSENVRNVFCGMCLNPEYRHFGSYEKLCTAPTLSELIEACGDKFFRFELQFWPNKHMTMDMWWATARDLKDKNYDEGGSTPEEAVAKLYLALNKKS